MTIPEYPVFAAAVEDHRFWAALAIAVLAGVVRGFSGFGSAQIYIPLIAAVYSPRVAAVTLLLIDTVGAAPFTVRAFAYCTWREVLPIYIAAAIAAPFGTLALMVVDPIVLRWFIAILVLSLVGVLMSGWRYHGRPSLPVTVGVGLILRIWRRRSADHRACRSHLLAEHGQQRPHGARQFAGLFPAARSDAVRHLLFAGPDHAGIAGAVACCSRFRFLSRPPPAPPYSTARRICSTAASPTPSSPRPR